VHIIDTVIALVEEAPPGQWAMWIQVIAAVAQAILAFVLVAVTYRYVKLTGAIADTSAAQVALEIEKRQVDEMRLLLDLESRARALRVALKAFPEHVGVVQHADSVFRESPIRTNEDLEQLRQIAARVGRDSAWLANEIALDLKWMLEKIQEVRRTTRLRGYRWQDFKWHEWERRYKRAMEKLERLESIAYRALLGDGNSVTSQPATASKQAGLFNEGALRMYGFLG